MELNKYKTDRVAEEEGRWFDIEGEAKVKLARVTCKGYRNAIRDLDRKIEQMREINETDAVDAMDEGRCRAFADHVIKGWEGITEEGDTLNFSPDVAYAALIDAPDFWDILFEVAANKENFRLVEEGAA